MSYIDETYGKQLEEALRGLVSRPALGQPWFGFHASEVPAGVLLFTATTHSRVLYADFWKYIQDKNLVRTEEEWQSIYSEQGWCPFYSDGDGIDTFRMPILEESEKLVGVWAISAPQQPISDATVEGIISELGVASNNALEANTKAETAISGLSGVVRSVNGVSADAAGNVSVGITNALMPNWNAVVSVGINNVYTAPVDGWAHWSCQGSGGGAFYLGSYQKGYAHTNASYSDANALMFPVGKGQTITATGGILEFIPARGAN